MIAASTSRHVFVSAEGEMRPGWSAAFPGAVASTTIPAAKDVDVLWLLLPEEGDMAALVQDARQQLDGKSVIVLTDIPEDAQGLLVLGAGAVGYCNAHAQDVVLQQVALSVQSGGVWIGPSLMQRLISGTVKQSALPQSAADLPSWKTTLTEREIEVADQLALGYTNKEIASHLFISERTVKAHLGSIFEKLGVRDRLQLILAVKSRPA